MSTAKNISMVLVCVTVCAAPCMAISPAAWTWISGSDSTDQHGVYASQDENDPNMPGTRNMAVSWTNGEGFWLFGGAGNAATGSGRLNDLWRFDGENWSCVSGSHSANQRGIYGTKGVPSGSNVPGAREGAVSWTDPNGALWLFGGYGYPASGGTNYLNDLWRFDGTNWTWRSGSNTGNQLGNYGTKGVAASSNVPGARENAVSWIDAGGNLWLFGGAGFSGAEIGWLNDLWKFDGTNWTWVSGSNTTNQAGVYGTKGVAAPSNVPGVRYGSVSWIDAAGRFWLFGGNGYAASGYSVLNDLWKFDGTNWTWVSGSNSTEHAGVYGTKGVAAPSNVPGARRAGVSWIDSEGKLWLFGGSTMEYANLSDLWKFDGTNWTWVSGPASADQAGVYGSQGETDMANTPGARYGCVAWIDGRANVWLFGGDGYAADGSFGTLNDLWRFGIPEDTEDFTGDGVIDGSDLAVLASQWLTNPTGMPSADIVPQPAGDGVVNFRDFAVLAARWLENL